MDRVSVSRKFYKNPSNTNPCLSNYFCADPTAIEYNGRLYVYGTNDNQQYEIEGDFGKNTYEKIKSLVCFSTEDMVNWTFHGIVNVEKIAPWALTSWAPAIISRLESDGFTHFYMYFSNTGCGVGVLTATDPLGPWTSPLDKSLVLEGMEGIEEVPNPFDPGACLDSDGEGWLVFGGGIAKGCNDSAPETSRVVKLGKDLVSIDSEYGKIPAPYFFESSNIAFINNTYVYYFNSNWVERKDWPYQVEKSTQCSINYMVSKNPLDKDSWEYKGNFFKNPGDQGLNYSNNHAHFVKFKNQYYLFYHTLTLQEDMDTNGGFRSICVDKLEINEETLEIKMCNGTRTGVKPICNLNGFTEVPGSTMCTSAQVTYDSTEIGKPIGAKAMEKGAWYSVKAVDFGSEAKSISGDIFSEKSAESEASFVEVRVDKVSGPTIAILTANNESEVELGQAVTGVHDLYFVFSNKDIVLKKWKLK